MTGDGEQAITHAQCESTGLELLCPSGHKVYRVQKVSYGALSPIKREGVAAGDPDQWGRWDTAKERTIYVASSELGAYTEALSAIKQNGLKRVNVGSLFTNELTPDQSIINEIDAEWKANGFMYIGAVPQSWRTQRQTYVLRLPNVGWFIDIGKAKTLEVLRKAIPNTIKDCGVDSELTTSHLFGENRDLTTRIAQFLRGRTLFDGSLPHGIAYPSKSGTDHICYAVWLRAVDDGKTLRSEPTKVVGSYQILSTDPAYRKAARHHSLKPY